MNNNETNICFPSDQQLCERNKLIIQEDSRQKLNGDYMIAQP